MNRKNIKSKIDTLKCYFIDIGNALLRAVRKNEIAPDWCVIRLLLVIICTGIGVLGFPRLNVPAAVADNGTGSPSIEVMPNEGTIGGQNYLKIINYQPNKDIIVTFGSGTIMAGDQRGYPNRCCR